ncbi:MAG: hypothetical protein WBN40_02340 [Pseudomonadales bacterium]
MATEASSRPTGFTRTLVTLLAVTLASLMFVYIYYVTPSNDSDATSVHIRPSPLTSSAAQPESAADKNLDTSGDSARLNSSTRASTAVSGPPPPRTLQELLQRTKEIGPAAPMQEVLANTKDAALVDGAYTIAENGITHRLPLTEKSQALHLRITDNGVMAGDADPVVRFTGPSGRWVLDAKTLDGAVLVDLPSKTLRAGFYIMDINPHQPRSVKQRRYILQLGNERIVASPANAQ